MDADTCIEFGLAHLENGEEGQALNCFYEKIKLRSCHARAYVGLRLIFDKRGKDGEAIKQYRKALKANSACSDAYLN